MNAMTPIDQVAHWHEQISALETRITAQETAVTEAQEAASQAALSGGDTDAAVRQVAHARDVLDALRTALGEARRHLRAAEDAAEAKARADALTRAQSLARRRIEAADKLDEYLREIDPLLAEWTGLGNSLAREMEAAGLRAPSAEGKEYRCRAGAWALAPAFMATIGAARVNNDHRVPFRQLTAAQAATVLKRE